MANKQVFTAYDVYGFKRSLALWSSKNNALIEKWSKALTDVEREIDELYEQNLSHGYANRALKRAYIRKVHQFHAQHQ